MMFSSRLQHYVEEIYARELPHFYALRPALEEKVCTLRGDEALLVKLALATLPISDVASVPFATLLGYARHAVFLRGNSPFAKALPEDLFLHFVFYPRNNTEPLVDCRRFFYDQLWPDVVDLSEEEAVLAVNRWCASKVSYEASDNRTEDPLTAYRSGYGRCGEESTFAVTALRSIGIAARQVYVPYWAHCDDNHAWVEAYVNGKWHFLGACEPEPVLDRGWFNDAASRAILVHSRTFFDYSGDGLRQEPYLSTKGCCLLYNQTARYADTATLKTRVFLPDGTPAAGARLIFQVLNYADFVEVAQLRTDGEGQAELAAGLGTLWVTASLDGCTAHCRVQVGAAAELCLTLAEQPLPTQHGATEPTGADMDFFAPTSSAHCRSVLTPVQAQAGAKAAATARAGHAARLEGWNKTTSMGIPQLDAILHLARGNALELLQFWNTLPEAQHEIAHAYLASLTEKDYKDATAEMLACHFAVAAANPDRWNDPLFVNSILCPRIRFEQLENWRSAVLARFSAEQLAAFAAAPQTLMPYLRQNYPLREAHYYHALPMQPSAVLSLGVADEQGRSILFVAVLRTAGVPARINPETELAEYYAGGSWYPAENSGKPAASATLRLLPAGGQTFRYAGNYSLALHTEAMPAGSWQVLDYTKAAPADGPVTLSVLPGDYRLTTVNRLPNGNQLAHVIHFSAKPGETVTLPLELRWADPAAMLEDNTLEPFAYHTLAGQTVPSGELLHHRQLLIYLDIGTEPTEHILNELLEAKAGVLSRMEAGLGLAFLIEDEQQLANDTFTRVRQALPDAQVLMADFADATANMLARKMYLEPGVWPLLVLLDDALRGYYASCGYRVGVVDFALRLADVSEKGGGEGRHV